MNLLSRREQKKMFDDVQKLQLSGYTLKMSLDFTHTVHFKRLNSVDAIA